MHDHVGQQQRHHKRALGKNGASRRRGKGAILSLDVCGRVCVRVGVRGGVPGVLGFILGLALMAALAPPARAAADVATRQTQPSAPATTFPTDGQALYESCNPADPVCVGNLDSMARGRFQLVLNYSQFTSNASLSDEIAYVQHADALGLRVIWPVDGFIFASGFGQTLAAAYPALGASLGQPGVCPGYNGTNYGFVRCFAHIIQSLPGTWGYYIGDELPASREQSIRPLVDAVYDADSVHPRLYVAASKGTSANRTDLAAYARSYCDGFECHSDATVIAQDFYPVGSSSPDQIATQTGAIAAGVQALAQQYNVAYGMVLQAHSLAQYPALYRNCTETSACPYPTQQQMLAMRDAVLAHATPCLLLWYSYFDLERSDNFVQHWTDTQVAANWGKPVIIRGSLLPSGTPAAAPPTATPASVAPAPTITSAKASAAGQPPQHDGETTSSTAEVPTPLGRLSAVAIEALAQLALLFVLIGGMRIAIGRTLSMRLPRR